MSDDLVVYEENDDNDDAEFDMLIEVEVQKCDEAIQAAQSEPPIITPAPEGE